MLMTELFIDTGRKSSIVPSFVSILSNEGIFLECFCSCIIWVFFKFIFNPSHDSISEHLFRYADTSSGEDTRPSMSSTNPIVFHVWARDDSLCEFSMVIAASMYRAKISGDRESPCGIPFSMGNTGESPHSDTVIACILVSRFIKIFISWGSKFLVCSIWCSLCGSTESYAASTSTKIRNCLARFVMFFCRAVLVTSNACCVPMFFLNPNCAGEIILKVGVSIKPYSLLLMVLVSIFRITFRSIMGLQAWGSSGSLPFGLCAGTIDPVFIRECRWHRSESWIIFSKSSWLVQEQDLMAVRYLFRHASRLCWMCCNTGWAPFSSSYWACSWDGSPLEGHIWNAILYIWAISSSTPAHLCDLRCNIELRSSLKVSGLSNLNWGFLFSGFSRFDATRFRKWSWVVVGKSDL